MALLFVVQACTTSSQTMKVSMPAWVLSPSSDTSEIIFGVGSGYSYNEAKQAALREITSKLIINISSHSKSELSVHDALVSRSANEQISTRTVETQLTGYQVLKSEQMGSEMFVQVSMSRPDFIKISSSSLKEIDGKIKAMMQDYSRKSKLQKLMIVQRLIPSIDKARTFVLLLQAAGAKQDTDRYLSYYNEIQYKSKAMLQEINFNINSSANLRGFAKHLIVLLQNENISASFANSKESDADIFIDGAVDSSIIFSQHMANMKITTRVSERNVRGGLVREFESSGSSVSNKKNAIEAAIESLGKQFTEKGVLISLGLVENK